MHISQNPGSIRRRVAIVGAGLMGQWHAHAVRQSGGRVVAVVDPDELAARRLSRKFSATTYASIIQCLTAGNIGAVHVCTPTATHAQIISHCINARLPVVVEKPLAMTAKSTRDLLESATRHGVEICPTHQYAFQRSVSTLVRHRRSLGSIAAIDLVFQTAGGGDESTRWHQVVADILPHPLSILQRLQPHSDLAAADWLVSSNGSGTWQLTASVDGALVRILMSVEARPTCAVLKVSGSLATFEADLFHDFGVWTSGRTSRMSKISGPALKAVGSLTASSLNLIARAARNEPAYPGLQALIERFYMNDGGTSPISPEHIVQIAEIRDLFLGSGTGAARSFIETKGQK